MATLAVASPLKTLNRSPGDHSRISLPSSVLHLPLPVPRWRCLRCSAQYSEAAAPTSTTTPRPAEIPWSKELCNSVRLIGTVGTDVELRQLPSGSAVARGRLAVWKSATETTWVTLQFWDDLAIVASEHVNKGDRIFVSGRLVSDTVNEGPEKRHVYYKLAVQQLNFIESQPVRLYEPEASQDAPGGRRADYFNSTSNSTEDKNRDNMSSSRSTEELWRTFFANPLDWWDNRTNKRTHENSRTKEKEVQIFTEGEDIWSVEWVNIETEIINSQMQLRKKNPRYPDFKHKHTGEALWVDGRNNPNWVVSQLAVLDSRMSSLQDNGRKPVSYMYADEFMTLDGNR